MPRIADIAEDDLVGWLAPRPELAAGLGALSDAVYNRSTLPLRIREIARMRIALDNECEVCRTMRDATGPAAGVDDEFYDHVPQWRTWDGFSAKEKVAAEFAERFATDHLQMDDDLWDRLHAAFTDDELVELGLCVGSWLAFGRLNRVFDVDGACRVDLKPHG